MGTTLFPSSFSHIFPVALSWFFLVILYLKLLFPFHYNFHLRFLIVATRLFVFFVAIFLLNKGDINFFAEGVRPFSLSGAV